MNPTSDLHVVETRPLVAPAVLHRELPLSPGAAATVSGARERIKAILHGRDPRLLVIVGPCSVHDLGAAREYAAAIAETQRLHHQQLEVVMRVYFEKPRTTVGWKGLINDPHLDHSYDINTGLRLARGLLLHLAELGLPAATELLDPVVPQYIADLISWTAIGARTTESQTHREMASGLSMPIGFKNGTDGSVLTAINAMEAAAAPIISLASVSWAMPPSFPPPATLTATWCCAAAKAAATITVRPWPPLPPAWPKPACRLG